MKFSARFLALAPVVSASRSRSGLPHRSRGRRGGSALVETAACLTFVLLPLLLGGLQYGLVVTTTHALEQVSREAGRFAAIHWGEPTFDNDENQGGGNKTPSLDYYIREIAIDNGIPWNDIKNKIDVTPAFGARVSGQPITVTIDYPMNKRSILGQPGKEAILYFAPGSGGNSKLNFLSQDYRIASTFIMQ